MAPAPTDPTRPPASPGLLVGRDAEVRRARAALEGPGVVVCGAPGVGATSLVDAVVPRPAARLVVTEAMRTQPLFALRTLLDPADDADDPLRVRAALVRSLAPAGRRPVLVVDDLDHLDDASAAVLAQLVADGAVRVAGVRQVRPARDGIAVLWRDLGLVRVDLAPLPDAAMAVLLERELGGSAEGRTQVDLLHLAAGNPYLLGEVCAASIAAGRLAPVGGLWKLEGEAALSADVTDLARRTLEGLDPAAHPAAEVLAVAGPLPWAMAASVLGLDGLEALERAGLVRSDDEAAPVRLADAVVAAHLRRTVPRSARQRIVAGLAAAAAAVGPDDDPDLFVRAAEWAVAAGEPVDAGRLLVAARTAVDLGDPARAEHLAAASAAATEEPSTEAVLLQSWCADERGAIDRSTAVLAGHVPLGDEAVVAVAIRRAEQQFWTFRDPQGAASLLREAAAAVAPPWNHAADAQQALFDLLDGRPEEAAAAADPLRDHPTRLVASAASLASALALVVADRPVEAAELAESSLASLAGPDPALYIDPGVHVISLGFALEGSGRLREADALTDAVYRHALSRPGRQAQGWAALIRSRVLTAMGRPVRALVVALEAEQIWRGANLVGLARWSATVAAQAAAEAGDVDTLAAALERIDADDPVPFRLFDPEVDRVRAWAASLDGDADRTRDARAELASAARRAAASGRRSLAVLAAADLVRLGDAALGAEVLAEVVVAASSVASQRRLAAARAVVAGDGSALEALAAAWEADGALGPAAECLAWAAAARPPRAAVLRSRVGELLGDGGLASPPLAELGLLAEATRLTAREREVVALVAEGLSNRAIADRLVVSTRTVENHLHRAFANLGVSSRADLVDLR